ncbi:MAG: signal peptidase I [Eubacteriales bacterium]|nr:signal peptidase I [Eubacteriales bacterium]
MRIIKYAANILIVCYFAALAILAIPPLAGFKLFAVISPSMSPAIMTGSIVYVQKRAFEDIEEGDIITYRIKNTETTITHRVTEKNETEKEFYTKGDANKTADAKAVRYEDVLGVVRLSLPFLGYAAFLLEGAENKIAAAVLMLWLLAMKIIIADVAEMKKEADIL